MPNSRKRKLRRLESKYKSFNHRTLITFLFVAFVLFLAGLSFAPEKKALAEKAEVSPLLYFAFIWTGLICMQLCGQFVLGTLRPKKNTDNLCGNQHGQSFSWWREFLWFITDYNVTWSRK